MDIYIQEVAVVGSQNEIGSWQTDGALKLQTNPEEYVSLYPKITAIPIIIEGHETAFNGF